MLFQHLAQLEHLVNGGCNWSISVYNGSSNTNREKEKYLNKIFSFDSDTLLMKSFYYDKNENCINCK